jgi:2',3'-cyclic-nucleotide 2'-phosphodiesterase (5'-nucleotidase family)
MHEFNHYYVTIAQRFPGKDFSTMLSATLLASVLALQGDSTLLRVLTLNDFHGALETRTHGWSNGRPVGGAAAVKSALDSARAACRCPAIVLDGGDEFQGTLASNLVFGRSTVEALNLFGLDVAVIGNHELDWGVDTLRARMRESRWHWTAANVFDSVTGRRPDWATPWRMIQRGGLRIAVIGYMSARSKQMIRAEDGKGLVWRRGVSAIRDALDSARSERPDLTILLAHEGGFCDTLPCRGEIIDLAGELDPAEVQLIVSGHTHSLVTTAVNGIPIIQARSNGTAYGIADWVRTASGERTWRLRVETVWADRVTPDREVEAVLEKYRPMVKTLAERPVATLRTALDREGDQHALGNLITDGQRAVVPGIDFALMNNGGIRRDLPAGRVSYEHLFELHPFGNNITRVWITGAVLKEVMEHAVSRGRPSFHVSGLVVRFDSRKPRGERVIDMRRLDGTLVVPARTYVLALPDFLQTGGEGLSMLRTLENRRTGKTDLETTIDYLRSLPQPVSGPRDRRFIDVAP